MPIFISKYKKFILSLVLILLISSLGIFVLGAGEAKASWYDGLINGLKTILGSALLTIQGVVGALVTWLAGLAQGILNFTNPQNAQIVQDGWEIVRDFVNMFFVLVLLVIAFATILRLETYGMKALLPKLIIAALLINFSLVLAGVFIDFAGILTVFFIEDGQKFFTDIADAMRLPKIMTTTAEEKGERWQCQYADPFLGSLYTGNWSTESECAAKCAGYTGGSCMTIPTAAKTTNWGKLGDTYWAVISALFFSIIFTVIAAFVFGALAILLLIRVLVIWFLLILAPIAWFFWILPATKHLFTQWWNTFIKWVFFAPAAIFFIWLSVNSWLKFIQGKAPFQGDKVVEGMEKVITDEVFASRLMPQIMEPKNFVQFVLICGMLLGSLIVAQKMGIAGASMALGVTKWFGKGAAGMANRFIARRRVPGVGLIGKGIKTGAGKFLEKMPRLAKWMGMERIKRGGEVMEATKGRGILSPGAWQRAWVQRRQRVEAESYSEGVGSLEDILDYAYSGGKEYHNRQYRATLGLAQQKLKELKETGDTSQPQLINTVKAGLRKGGIGGKAEVMAATWQLFAQADEEGLMGDKELGKPYGYKTDPVNIQDFIKKQIGEGDNEKRFAASLGNIARLAGIPQYDGMVETDPATGQMKWTDKGKIGVIGAIQASKIWAQNKAMILARRTYGIEDEPTGKFDGLHTASRELLRRISGEDVIEVRNIPTFTKQWLVEGEKRAGSLRKFADEIENGYATTYLTEEGIMGYKANKEKADMFRKWIDELEKQVPPATVP
ncbi:MAG: hypothetical protein ISS88_00360 [Candidatus Portnoybacteria bacterium]|nr:hypothetical protein [Candidatus Portnoybacteria bacterium]